MAYTAQDWTLSALAVEIGINRRTLGLRLAGLKPVRESGKIKYYRLADVVRALIEHAGNPGDPAAQRARLDQLRGDQIEFDLNIKRGEYAPIEMLKFALSDVANQIKSIFEAIPKRIKNSMPSLRAREMKILERELIKAQNAASEIRVRFDTTD